MSGSGDTGRVDMRQLARDAFVGAPHGLRTSRELDAAGLGVLAVRALVRSGVLIRVTTGYFALAQPAVGEVAALVRRGRAIESRYDGRAVISHHVAVAAHGLPLLKVPMSTAHLTYRRGGSYRIRADCVVHAAPAGQDLAAGESLPLAEALVQCGATWGVDPFVVAADAAIHKGLVNSAELERVVAARKEAPHHPTLVRALRLVDGLSESPGESLARLRIGALGHRLRSQVETVARGRRYRIDLVIEGTRVAIEFDGMGKYADPRALRAEKAREEDLRVSGWIVVRLQWSEVDRPEVIRQRINWALAEDARRRAVA